MNFKTFRRRILFIYKLAPLLPGLCIGYLLLPFIFFILFFVRPILLIRIQPIISWRLGHFAGNLEVYLSEHDAGINIPQKNHLDIWYLWTKPCNIQLSKMWRRTVNIGPFFILHPLFNLLKKMKYFHEHLIDNQDRDIHNLFDATNPHLTFTNNELSKGREELVKLGVPHGKYFICLNVRDDKYLNEQSRSVGANVDWSYHDYRNCDIKNYLMVADELTKLGYYVIRMGASVNKKMETTNPMVIDYAGDGLRSDFMDIYLGAHCEFCISNGTGFDAVPYIFRRPIIYIDHVPLRIINTFSSKFMATTKVHWLKSENRQMSLEEILASDVGWYTQSKDFEAAGVELRESSPSEITQAVLEMEGRLAGTWHSSEEDEKLQAYFWSIFPKNHWHGEIRSRVGSHFLRTRLKRDFLETPSDSSAFKTVQLVN